MKMLILVVLGLCVVVAQAAVTYQPITTDYHNEIGIPEAARIKTAEEAALTNPSRIVGGSPARLEQFPYQAGLLIDLTTGQTSVCGASIINSRRLLTAAHCWRSRTSQAVQFTVVLGSTTLFLGGTRFNTTNVDVHANYNADTLNNDIAMILAPLIELNNLIYSVGLPSYYWASFDFTGKDVIASGFGRTSDFSGIGTNQSLSYVTMPVMTNEECAMYYGTTTVVDSTICTSGVGGRSTCGGDSGGPVVYSTGSADILVGIVSFGSVWGCQLGFPAGHVRVSSFNAWIQARL